MCLFINGGWGELTALTHESGLFVRVSVAMVTSSGDSSLYGALGNPSPSVPITKEGVHPGGGGMDWG